MTTSSARPRIRLRPWCTAAGAVLASLSACGPPAEPSDPGANHRLPDVLLISIDTLRADRLSCYGYERKTTPRIDAIAAEGVRFADPHAPSVITAPSHMSLLTGLDPVAHGVTNANRDSSAFVILSEQVQTWPALLKRAGYSTAAFTDGGNLQPVMGFERGFDHYHSRQEPLTRKINTLRPWLKQQPRDEPLFLFFHTYATHAPYYPAEAIRGRYTDPAYDGPFRRRFEDLFETRGSKPSKRRNVLARSFLETWEGMDDEDLRFLSDLYDETVASTDAKIGHLWDLWSRNRDADNTLLIIVSDHGEAFGEHGLVGHKGDPHRELVSVPLILRGPGLEPRVVETPVSLTGLLPTVLEYLEIPGLDFQQGSFLELARGHEQELLPLFSQLPADEFQDGAQSASEGGLRLIRREVDGKATLELYDWTLDHAESDNLVGGRPESASRLLELMQTRWRDGLRRREARPPSVGGQPEPQVLLELEALGYVGDD